MNFPERPQRILGEETLFAIVNVKNISMYENYFRFANHC